MSHPQQLEFISQVKKHFIASHIPDVRILEVGSYDLNGSVRQLFTGCDYVGADLVEGPGVDLVCGGEEIDLPDVSIDAALSCECFEHNPAWVETFRNMHRMAKPGGLVVITCATLGRVEHGTSRTNPASSPGTQAVGIDYYKNLGQADFESSLDLAKMFAEFRFFEVPSSRDLYFIGRKHGGDIFGGDMDRLANDAVQIESMHKQSLWRRATALPPEFPLSAARKFLPEERFQDFAVRYLRTFAKVAKPPYLAVKKITGSLKR